jgi:hypothetical protein
VHWWINSLLPSIIWLGGAGFYAYLQKPAGGSVFEVRTDALGWPYRFMRNPIYLAGITLLAGIGLLYEPWRVTDFVLPVALFVYFHLAVNLVEEPALRSQFGDIYSAYCQRVPRWLWRGAAQAALAIGIIYATCATFHASGSASQGRNRQAPAGCVPLPSEVIRSPLFQDWLRTNAIDRPLCRTGSVDIKDLNRSVASSYQLQSECREAIADAGGEAQMIVSPSGRRAVCMGSFGEPENDVFLVGLAKGEGRWLQACGTPCNYDTGFWLGDDRFVLLERDDLEGGRKSFLPVVVVFDLRREVGQRWTIGAE